MFALLAIELLGACLVSSSDIPEIKGRWSGEDWGTVYLNRTGPGQYTGTYAERGGKRSGTIEVKWSETDERFHGTWREGEDRFGDLALKRVGDEIRGALTSGVGSKTDRARPSLADVTWTRGEASQGLPGPAGDAPLAQPLDLKGFYQTRATSFERMRGYPWRIVPRGSQTLGNVPLDIGGLMILWGEANAKAGASYPEKFSDIPVGRAFDTLYVYHAAFYTARDGSPVYHLTLQYENGTSSTTTLCYGAHLRDWFQTPDEPVTGLSDSKSKTVWRADNPDSNPGYPLKVRFFITAITNPRPSLAVKSISLASAKGNAAGCILAMTTGPADLLRDEKARGK